MTVADLIEVLSTFPKDAPVRISQPQSNECQSWNDYPELCEAVLDIVANEVRLTE